MSNWKRKRRNKAKRARAAIAQAEAAEESWPVNPAEVLALYQLPFELCPYDRFVLDAQGHMVADSGEDYEAPHFRPRGWGRISYKPNAANLHDAVSWVMLDAVRGVEGDMTECVGRLNQAWEAWG